MSPDADGRFRGMVVPRVPWHEEPEEEIAERLADEAEQGYNLSQGRRVTREQVERAAGG